MGAGVTWKDQAHPDRSVCVKGNYATITRAELAAIALALQQANITETVILLFDSTAAVRHIARFKSRDFRPDWESCKDLDIMRVILDIIRARQAVGSQTLFVKVHDHSAHPLHTLPDTGRTRHRSRGGILRNYLPARLARLEYNGPNDMDRMGPTRPALCDTGNN